MSHNTAAKKGGYPLQRAELASIVEAVARLEPRVIAFDLLLLDHGNDQADAALAQALGKRPTVIAAAAVFPQAIQSVEDSDDSLLARLPRAEKFLLPLKMFTDRAAVGMVNLTTDQSGTARGFPMLCRTGDRLELSFPLRAAALAEAAEPVIGTDKLTLAGGDGSTGLDSALHSALYIRQGPIW